MHTADHALLNRWIDQRDAQAFKALTVKYCAMVYGTSVRILRNAADAEEITQECFAALAAAGQTPQGSMGAWLHRIATYQALNRRRLDQRRLERESRFAQTNPTASEPQWNDISQFIDQSIEALPHKIRVAIVAHFIEDESVTAIAAREGVTHSAISQRIQKGVALIRERMHQNGIPIGAAVLAAALTQHANAWPAVPTTLSATLGKLAITGIAHHAQRAPTPFATKLAAAAAVAVVAATVIGYAMRTPARSVTATQLDPQPDIVQHAAAVANEPAPEGPPPPNPEPTAIPATQPTERAPLEVVIPAESKPAAPEPTTWQEVVDAYVAHQNRIRRISFDFDDAASGPYYWYDYKPQPRGYREFFKRGYLITDGNRCSLREYRWGHTFGEILPPNEAQVGIYAYDGDTWASCSYSLRQPKGLIDIQPNAKQSMIKDSAFNNGRVYLLYGRYPAGPMLGLPFDQEGLRMEDFLRRAEQTVLRPEKETGCYVIDADTDHGVFTVWFDPAHDYNIAKSVIELGGGDIYERHPLMEGTSAYYEYVVEQFVEVDGLWVPAQAALRKIARLRGGNGHDYTHHHTRSNIQILEKGDDDDEYVIYAEDIPNGAELMTSGFRSSKAPRWLWFNDRFVLTHKDQRPSTETRDANARGFGGGIIATKAAR